MFAHELFVVLAGPAFRQGYRLVPALAFVCCLFCFANAFAQGLQAKQRTVHYAWIGNRDVRGISRHRPFPEWNLGGLGDLVAMGGGFFTMLLLLQLTSHRLMPVDYPWARHGLMWLITEAIIAFTYSLDISWPAAAAKLAA